MASRWPFLLIKNSVASCGTKITDYAGAVLNPCIYAAQSSGTN